jgi:tetratricopeptide (TPR) repeat protein
VTTLGAVVQLPNVPSFTLPAPPTDGTHTVKELRVAGGKLLDTSLAVRGVITWVYDCVTDIRRAGESDRQVHARIDADPTLCERPKFYVGDTRDTPPDQSLWVVDVPREYNKLELQVTSKQDRTQPDRCEPGDHARKLCPPYKVGDEVLVVGKLATSSPHSERNSDGLLVYAAMRNDTQHWETTGGAAIPATTPSTPPTHPKPARLPAPPKVAMRKVVPAGVRDASRKHADAATRAFALKPFPEARAEYQRAIAAWDGNHLAWYGMGAAAAFAGDWSAARDAFAHAAALRPDSAMYQMWLGVAAYEAAIADARADQARRLGVNPEQVVVDYGAIDFTVALAHLTEALRLDDALWRAQFYLGRVHRAFDEPREAATAFTAAITRNPREAGPYIALGMLYEKWDYTDLAIQVTAQGTQNVTGGDLADIWYVLGTSYDQRRLDDKAIEAFTRALEARPDHAKASFQRGQIYFRRGDFVHAKSDLEAFLQANAPGVDFARQQAQAMLAAIAAKKRR